MSRGVKIHDIEVFPNMFLYYDIDRDTGEEHIFALWDTINELSLLVDYLKQKHKLVGYNSIGYDGQVLQYIIDNINNFRYISNNEVIQEIHRYSANVIATSRVGGYPPLPEYKLFNRQLDLFKLWHFDNKNRWTRLKDLQVAMDWPSVVDMPIHYTKTIDSYEEYQTVINYCRNDVKSTFEFYKRSKSQIDLRSALSRTFNLNLMSSSDPSIGSEICAKLLSSKLGISTRDLKSLRTYRGSIPLGNLLLPYIKYDNYNLIQLLDTVKRSVIKDTKGEFNQKVRVKGFTFDMKLGGIHGCVKAGRYGKGKKILDIDVQSFYPRLAMVNSWFPEHLGIGFCEVMQWIFDERVKVPKSDPKNYAYKIILNGVYGKSNDKNSYFYDPSFTMQITVNGQLLILMLAEKLLELDVEILQANTDGITIIYDEDISESAIFDICNNWMKITNLKLEYARYKEMIIKDVSNYIAIYEDATKEPKYKGTFELFDTHNKDFKDWNKDPSFRVVPRAVSDYFIKDIPVEDSIKRCKDIFCFVGRQKFKSDQEGETRCVDENFNIIKNKEQDTTRYLVTNKGCTFHKKYTGGKEEYINKGYVVTIYNNHIEKRFADYDINYRFYIEEANKIIEVIEGNKNQLSLF